MGCLWDMYFFPFGYGGLPAHSEAEQNAHYEQNDCVECYDCIHFCDFPFFVFHNNEFLIHKYSKCD